ncbi:hypothetical protein JCM8097_000554 [Rhodosporidiobolus ruineniae]
MGSTSSAPPAFLAITSRPALLSILSTLQDREQHRRMLADAGRLRANKPKNAGLGYVRTSRNGADGGGQPGGADEVDWFSVQAGSTRGNMGKNRYGDIIAYDRTRCLPPLRTSSFSPSSSSEPDYVNASLVREPDLGVRPPEGLERKWWVAAQAPIEETVHDFLSLLLTPPTSAAYQASSAPPLPQINLVVQLTPLVEGRRQKCHPYFPAEVGETWDLPSASGKAGQGVWVRLDGKEEKDGARTSELRVGKEGDGQGKRVVHVEYLGWRDHGIPESPRHLVRFIRRVHSLNASLSSSSSSSSSTSSSPAPAAPILIHCSAGVGRTGTFIAISSLLPFLSLLRSQPSLLSSPPVPPLIPEHPLGAYPAATLLPGGMPDYVGATVDALRDQRTTMCQTQEQVLWVYQCLIAAWEDGLVRVG